MQQFDEPASDLVFSDLIASVDGLIARKQAIAVQLSELVSDERWWPTVAPLRAFRGIDTLTALSIHLELGGDCKRFEKASSLSAWLGLTPSLSQSGESSRQGSMTKTGWEVVPAVVELRDGGPGCDGQAVASVAVSSMVVG